MKNRNKLIVFVIVTTAVIGSFRHCQIKNKIIKEGVFCIGYIEDRSGAKGGVRLRYIYRFKSKLYVRESVTNRTDIYAGDSVYLRLLKNDPGGWSIIYKDTLELQ